jgi:type IV pilus assembly protein PilA
MIARIHKTMEKKDKGFTLIELLVVIIIIGILAAIAIPVFLNQRKKAVDAGIKSDLRTIANEAESYFVDHQAYPATVSSTGDLTLTTGVTITASNANTAFTFTNATDSYTITGQHSTSGTGATYTYDAANGGLAD